MFLPFTPEYLTAGPRFKRWRVIAAALGINFSIGQVYAFSVFLLPLTRLIGIEDSVPGDWPLTTISWIFTLAYVFLGLSAGFSGTWQDRVGPRVSGLVAAACFGGGFMIAALGAWTHQIVLVYLGYGVVGGCGLGIGFNTPIPVLIRWFPDHRGFATGLAVMGFGGGAIIGAPVSQWLMARMASPTSVGVAETWFILGWIYLIVMGVSAWTFRLPPPGWAPAGVQNTARTATAVTEFTAADAVRTKQFYLLWTIMLLNVSAGLGLLGQASAMVQEMFSGFSASAAAWFVAALSLFNMLGRLMWASLSDIIGRRTTFAIFLGVGALAYAAIPHLGRQQDLMLFVGCFALILSMYGGGFATMPPYIADLFGSRHVGAINGRVLTALSLGGVIGPALMNYLREYLLLQGYPRNHVYDWTMYIMAGLLAVGFLCNLAVRPIAGDVT
jgi:MFS family permease